MWTHLRRINNSAHRSVNQTHGRIPILGGWGEDGEVMVRRMRMRSLRYSSEGKCRSGSHFEGMKVPPGDPSLQPAEAQWSHDVTCDAQTSGWVTRQTNKIPIRHHPHWQRKRKVLIRVYLCLQAVTWSVNYDTSASHQIHSVVFKRHYWRFTPNMNDVYEKQSKIVHLWFQVLCTANRFKFVYF